MTKPEFDAAVDQLCVRFGGSVTSGRRTVKHSIAVGGFDGDPHTWGMGNDVVWDVTPPLEVVEAAAKQFGLKVLREVKKLEWDVIHDHFQPIGWVNKPHTPEAA